MVWHYERVFIGGEWAAPLGPERIEVRSPATDAVVGSLPLASPSEVDRAVGAARKAFDEGPWPDWSPEDRAQAVERLTKAIAERSEQFVDVLVAEVGLPRRALPAGQIRKSEAVFEAMTEAARDYPWTSSRPGTGGRSLTVRRLPVGVVGAIVPWNAPLFVAALKLAPALLSGCTVVLKPPVEAPLHSYVLAEAARDAGLPEGVLNIAAADVEGSAHLVAHPDVDKISFTGSTEVGRKVGEVCGRDLRRCTLELGGKSAAIVLDDLQMDEQIAMMIAFGAMANSGQVCAAQSRILVPERRHDEILQSLVAAAESFVVGDPEGEDTQLGPLISSAHRDRVEGYIERGRREGARLLTGGGRPDVESGWYVEPTVFADVTPEMTIAQEEIFGPVAVVLPYRDEAEAVALANDSRYGLAGAVWSGDPEHAEAVAGRVRTGSVSVNSPAPLDACGPFGGMKSSGVGREGGPEGLDEYVEHQTIVRPVSS